MAAYEDFKMMLNSPEVHDAIEARRRFMDKHLINGQLLVTQAQYLELTQMAYEGKLALCPPVEIRSATWADIPVKMVPEDEPVDVGNNQMAIHKFDSIIVFPKPDYFGPLIEDRIIDVS
jgi:hypothetical protein